jgi:DNA modification methylase
VKPYYKDRGITIYHGDCREILPSLQYDPLVTVLTDPPYGIGKAAWDTDFPLWWFDLAAGLGPRMGVMPGPWNLLRCPQSTGDLRYRWTLAAHLVNGMTRGAMGFGNWIPCVVYAKQNESAAWCARFAEWCDSQKIARRDLDSVCGTSDMGGWWMSRLPHRAEIPTPENWARIRMRFAPPDEFTAEVEAQRYEADGDCRRFVVGREDKPNHPSPKPIGPVTWFLQRLPGQTVIDPFAGSFTTIRAAKNLGRRAIGIEIEERYCEIGARRLEQEVLDLGGVA